MQEMQKQQYNGLKRLVYVLAKTAVLVKKKKKKNHHKLVEGKNKTEQTNKQEQKKGEPVSPGSALGAGSGHGSGRSAARAALRAGPGRAARGAALLPPGAARGSVRPLRAERRLRKAPSRLRGAAVSIVNAICH